MRHLLVALSLMLGSATTADAQVSVHVGVGVALPGVEIGIHVPAYPHLVRVPGYPVYYAPAASSNYFFYDGAYWAFANDGWYVSSWYAGPWYAVAPESVPVYVLRVPVRYYRVPPPYFRAWRADAPPRWGERWGRDWEHRRAGWDRWDRRSSPRPAPLPAYQRGYSGDRYPHAPERQREIRTTRYGYEPRESVTREHYGHRDDGRGDHERKAPRHEGRGKGDERGRDHR
jgi:hypothetical protein